MEAAAQPIPTTTAPPLIAVGGGGGPAPFLLKTYDMVDEPSTNDVVSWSPGGGSFVVWNHPEFSRDLLPTYFKHSNFSSFIRQLNTYGFRKIDPDRWEFSNEDFIKDKRHLLKNIRRRKPIHSHSNPSAGTAVPERASCNGEIDRLNSEKATLEAKLSKLKKQLSIGKVHMEELLEHVGSMEQRQENLLGLLEKSLQHPSFAEHLARKIESLDLSVYNKRRRLPSADPTQPVVENSVVEVDNLSSSRREIGNLFPQDFSNKLRLELSPAVSDMNVISHSTQSSNEDGGASTCRIMSEGGPGDSRTSTGRLMNNPEAPELSDTGTSFTFGINPSSQPISSSVTGSPRLPSVLPDSVYNEECENHVSCQLNLSLASSPLQVDKSQHLTHIKIGKLPETQPAPSIRESDFEVLQNRTRTDKHANSSYPEPQRKNSGAVVATARVNDLFWEQFLTERPGAADNEGADSGYQGNQYEEQEQRRQGLGRILANARNMGQLTLR